jgi:guanine deaminase
MASYGSQLLEWLHNYIFPAEEVFKDDKKAREGARFFLKQLLREGTTTAGVYSSVHKTATDILFEEAEALDMRMIMGKCLVDRNGPENYASYDTPESAYNDCKELITKWHGRKRLSYALTPRFAPSCTRELLSVVSLLKKEHPDVYCQTHLCENHNEIKWVKELFPECKTYLDIYDHFKLLGEKTILGHCLHLTEQDFKRLHATKSVLCPCPPSNFFLGSGFYKFDQALKFHARTALASDVGAGNSFSMLKAMEEGYKMAELQGFQLSPLAAFYLTTLGNAKALSLDDKIGSFDAGKEADFIVLDLKSTPLIEYRMQFTHSIIDKLFVLMMMGDDRTISETYIHGKKQYSKQTD